MLLFPLLLVTGVFANPLEHHLLEFQGQELSREIPTCRSSSVLSCEKVLVNYENLFSASEILLPNDLRMTVSRSLNSGSETTKSFTLDNEEERAQGVFVYDEIDNKRYITGTLNWAKSGKHFKLETCPHMEDCYTWSEVNTDKWVDNHRSLTYPPDRADDDDANQDHERLLEMGRIDTTTQVTVTVTVFTTTQFRSSFNSSAAMKNFINTVITETNQGYTNSKIPITMKLHCIVNATFADNANSSVLLSTFLKARGSQTLQQYRVSADVAVVLSGIMSDNCGLAYTNVTSNGQTLGVVAKSCATGYYSFGHEIAHMAGCLHNREKYSTTYANPYYPNAFGYLIKPTSGYRTILAYTDPLYATRVNWYSNPNVKYANYATGTLKDNNADALINRRFLMAAVGTELIKCPA